MDTQLGNIQVLLHLLEDAVVNLEMSAKGHQAGQLETVKSNKLLLQIWIKDIDITIYYLEAVGDTAIISLHAI